ncbi:xylulokinase [Halomonas sp. ATBC28]|uniref:Xylulose kinase n=1 Tax=Vreelandella titanicae TaxID=664683 RepID=A0AAP9NHW9_9GAMM|nr:MULTISPECIES: xylulokinase [Halomonas]QKS22470.1 Xylulose kinase [Halomonas titanicae]TMU25699.1 xylulokinase [Halomonas sp. ATBC28]CDG51919.1 Xylulose kinase [Halomonas sp. A3H3]SDI04079.1 xylulokinase [Halomonas titanicae]
MYIGVDCGTQSTKVVVVDVERGKILAEASRPHHLDEGENGRREQAPAEWLAALKAAFFAALDKAAVSASQVRGIGVSGQQHGMVALDGEGVPVYPAKLWCDTETSAQNADLVARLGGEAGCLEKLGLVLQTGYTASKVAWLREHQPDAYRRIESLLLPHDYLNFWLTGERLTEAGDASGTGYFDTRKRCWQLDVFAEIAPELDPHRVLPRVLEAHESVGVVRPAVARELGLGDQVVVSSGGGDNMLGAIGTGNITPGLITLSLGTSGTVCAYSAMPVECDSAMVANFCSSTGGWLPLICTMNVTSATTRVRELFGLDLAAFGEKVASAPIGAEGVTVLPFFNGERVPMLPDASADFLGLTSLNTTQANLCRAVVEGATFGLRYGLELLGDLTAGASQIRLIGGGANSPVWRQMVADITGTQVICPEITDAAALGAAIQAAWCDQRSEGVTLEALCERLVHLDAKSLANPQPENVAAYQPIYARYCAALEQRHGGA